MTLDERKRNIVLTAALSLAKGLNAADVKKLIDYFGSAEAVFNSKRDDIIRIIEPKKNVAAMAENLLRLDSLKQLGEEISRAEDTGVSFLLYTDDDYPDRLKQISDPPALLYVRGKILPCDEVSLAVVGTRRPTNYGRIAATWLGKELADCRITVVSGMARGIDTEAHKAAIEAGGRTIAVLGTGIDVVYPVENKKLKEQIESCGATVTEYPVGAQPDAWRFPARNRIIGGMTMGTIVVEAPENSGALITARLALDYNREVFAVPGNITSIKSKGCHRLIREGAKMVDNIEDILEEFGMEKPKKKSTLNLADLSPAERSILEAISEEGAIPEDIIQRTNLAPYIVSGTLLSLELKGIIKKMPKNVFVKIQNLI